MASMNGEMGYDELVRIAYPDAYLAFINDHYRVFVPWLHRYIGEPARVPTRAWQNAWELRRTRHLFFCPWELVTFTNWTQARREAVAQQKERGGIWYVTHSRNLFVVVASNRYRKSLGVIKSTVEG
jgi:hypothetical protein